MGSILVKRANVILDIPDYQESEYLAKGFDVIDSKGNVVVKTTPSDPNELKKAFKELSEKVKALEEENKTLKAKLAEKVEKPKKSKEEPVEEEFTPINKRKSRKSK